MPCIKNEIKDVNIIELKRIKIILSDPQYINSIIPVHVKQVFCVIGIPNLYFNPCRWSENGN